MCVSVCVERISVLCAKQFVCCLLTSFCFQVLAIDSFPLSHSRYVVTAFITRAPACCEIRLWNCLPISSTWRVLQAYTMIVGQTNGELLQFYSAHLSTSQRRLVSLFSQKFCRCALAVENCSFFSQDPSMCIPGKLFSLFLPENSSTRITWGELFIFCTTYISVHHRGSCGRFLHKIWQRASWLYL